MFLFITYFVQAILGYTPLVSGLLFLPFSAGVILSAGLASRLLPAFGPRWVTFVGLLAVVVVVAVGALVSVNTAKFAGPVVFTKPNLPPTYTVEPCTATAAISPLVLYLNCGLHPSGLPVVASTAPAYCV